MSGTGPKADSVGRQGRIAAAVIALSGILAIFAPSFGLPVRFEMLIYLVALGGFAWAFIVALRLWRIARRNERD